MIHDIILVVLRALFKKQVWASDLERGMCVPRTRAHSSKKRWDSFFFSFFFKLHYLLKGT